MGNFVRHFSRWVTSVLILGAVVVVFNKLVGQFVDELLLHFGLDGGALAAPVVELAKQTWLHLAAALLTGFSAGVLVHHYATIYDRGKRLDMQLVGRKLSELERALAQLENQIWVSPPQFSIDALERVVNQTRSLELTLNEYGLETPHLSYEVDPVGFVERMRRYASKVGPLIEEGHKWHAIEESRKLSHALRNEGPQA
jgi:hypothetical protein